MKQHPLLHRLVRKYLRGDPFIGTLSDYAWYRRIIGGYWQRFYVSDPVDSYAWFRRDTLDSERPPLCREAPVADENHPICYP